MPESITNVEGNPINALYGYLLFVSKFLNTCKPEQLAFAFDESLESCFRNRIYPLYKSSRGLPDEQLAFQLRACQKVTESLGLACFSSKRYEADDLIGSLATQWRNSVSKIVIVSRDKDLGQLLEGKDELWDFVSDERYSQQTFREKFQVKPQQFVDYLALVGDAVDDIPGVNGVGSKAAIALLQAFSNLDDIYNNPEKIGTLKIRGAQALQTKLTEQKDMAFISRALAKIHCELELVNDLHELKWQGINQKKFKAALTRAGIQQRNRKALEKAFVDFESV